MRAYPRIVQRFDAEYGGPTLKNKRKPKGRDKLVLVLDHLAKHRNSTCKEIANQEWEKKVKSKIKLKSITDDVRKFIYKNGLIETDLVRISGKKKEYNKEANTFELTPFGILYAIHMLEKNPNKPRFFESIIREYKEDISVFKTIEVFKKIFQERYYKIIGIGNIADYGIKKSESFLEHNQILDDFVEYSHGAWLGRIFMNGRWKTEISFAILNNTLRSILQISLYDSLRDKEFEESFKSIWESIMKDNQEIKKEYIEFVNESIEANQKRVQELKEISRLLTHYDVNPYRNM